MRRRSPQLLYASCVLLLNSVGVDQLARGEPELAPPDKIEAFLVDELTELRPELSGSTDRATLHPTPLLRFTNPISGADGGVFVWTVEDRPVALTKAHVNARKWAFNLTTVSLWSERFSMPQPDGSTWVPETTALTSVALTALEPPPALAAHRVAQMKQIAQDFVIEDAWRNATKMETETYVLRLLSRPLYRYSSAKYNIVDGAVFGFCQGTNPEAIVQIEAVSMNEGLQWRCGVSRLTGHAITARYQGRLVVQEKSILEDRPTLRSCYWSVREPFPAILDAGP